jgi:hypothetical protein
VWFQDEMRVGHIRRTRARARGREQPMINAPSRPTCSVRSVPTAAPVPLSCCRPWDDAKVQCRNGGQGQANELLPGVERRTSPSEAEPVNDPSELGRATPVPAEPIAVE